MRHPAVVVVNTNGGDKLLRCLDALARQTRPAAELLVVDHCSTDGSPEAAAGRFPRVRVLRKETNAGYGAAGNLGIRETTGDPVVLMNEDVILEPDWLDVVASAMAADPRVGIVGGLLLFPEGLIQHAGGFLHRPLMLADHFAYRQPADAAPTEARDVEYVTGAVIAMRRAALAQLGGFDEGFPAYFEETDLCHRARAAGWAVRYLPNARGVHLESASYKRDSPRYYRLYHHGRVRFALKHLTPAEFLCQFVPAERGRIANVVALEELVGLRHAFVDHSALLVRPDGGGLAAAQPELRPALADALADLAQRAVATTPTGVAAAPASFAGLASRAEVAPRPFRSAVPLIGPAIAAVRGAWNWMSTRWYLAPILEQQNAYNREVADALAHLDARLAALEARADLPAGWLAEIDRDLTALARRVAAQAPPPPSPKGREGHG